MDDPFVSCPYEPTHRVKRSRIQIHIVKCEKKYPQLHICPYNATHRLPEEEMKVHVVNCPTKRFIFPEHREPKYKVYSSNPRPIQQKDYLPETDPEHEMWDD